MSTVFLSPGVWGDFWRRSGLKVGAVVLVSALEDYDDPSFFAVLDEEVKKSSDGPDWWMTRIADGSKVLVCDVMIIREATPLEVLASA